MDRLFYQPHAFKEVIQKTFPFEDKKPCIDVEEEVGPKG